jgi:LAGLIDADG DNA endonuclease family
MIQLPPYQKSIIIGLILSDGWLGFTHPANKNAHLELNQSISHSKYVWFVFFLLAHYCSSYPKLVTGLKSGIPIYSLRVCTRSLPCFTELYSLFYPDKVKIISEDIYDLLTPVALAH